MDSHGAGAGAPWGFLSSGFSPPFTPLLDLAKWAAAVEIGKGGDPFTRMGFDQSDDGRSRITRARARWLQTTFVNGE